MDERKADMKAYGDHYEGKSVSVPLTVTPACVNSLPRLQIDMLQLVLEAALPRQHTDSQIATRIMLLNFAAIHT